MTDVYFLRLDHKFAGKCSRAIVLDGVLRIDPP
jgi:hypothetical protein